MSVCPHGVLMRSEYDSSYNAPSTIYGRVFFPSRWSGGKESACQYRRCRWRRFNPRVGRIPWKRKWQAAPVFLLRKPHGQKSLAGYSPWGPEESDTTEQWLHTHSPIARGPRSVCFSLGLSQMAEASGQPPSLPPVAGPWERPQQAVPSSFSHPRPSLLSASFPSSEEPLAIPSSRLRSLVRQVCVGGWGGLPLQASSLNRYLLTCSLEKKKNSWGASEASGSSALALHSQTDSCAATENARETQVPLYWHRWLSTWFPRLNREVVDTRRCVVGVHKSPVRDSYSLYSLSVFSRQASWTYTGICHSGSSLPSNDSIHLPHLAMCRTAMCEYGYHFFS